MLARILFPVALSILTVATASSPLLANRAAQVNAPLNALQQAVRHNNIPIAKQVIAEAIRSGEIADIINVQDAAGRTPLHDAVIRYRWEMMELLLDAGADAQLKDRSNKSPLNYAIADLHRHKKFSGEDGFGAGINPFWYAFTFVIAPYYAIAEIFRIQSRAPGIAIGRDSWSTIWHTWTRDIVKQLKVAVESLEQTELPIRRLRAAALTQEHEYVQQLVDTDMEVRNLLFHEDLAPLLENESTRALLIEVGSMNITNKTGTTLLLRTLQQELFYSKTVNFAKSLIAGGADVNVANHSGSPLQAVLEGYSKYRSGAAESLELLQLLKDKGADFDAVNDTTILTTAVERGDLPAVRFWLDNLKIPELEAVLLRTAVERGDLSVVQFLLDNGVKVPEAEDVLLLASSSGHSQIRDLLLANGQYPNLKGRLGAELLLDTLLHGDSAFAKVLIEEHDVDVSAAASNYEVPPLMIVIGARADNHFYDEHRYSEAEMLELLQLLKDKGADLDAAISSEHAEALLLEKHPLGRVYSRWIHPGGTALMLAIRLGDLPAARFLLENGADVKKLLNSEIAVRVPAEPKSLAIVDLLMEYGADPETTVTITRR